jgi:uncharacterized membrane protein
MDDAISQPSLACPACRIIDRADGIEDGKLYKTEHYPVGNERRIAAAIKRSEDRVADRITAFAGSLKFVYMHTAWFAVWIVINVGLFGAALEFDAFPFGLLTMVVSLEAIFLATFVMVSQNRQAARSDLRSDLDFENNLRSEIWAVHIGQALGIDAQHVESVVRAAMDGYRAETSVTASKGQPAPTAG